MYDFNYKRASSIDDASSSMANADDGKFVAGGMTLLPTLKQRLAMPSDLVDLADLDDLVGGRQVRVSAFGGRAVVGVVGVTIASKRATCFPKTAWSFFL